MDLALTNRVLTASEALEWGLVSRVAADGEFLAVAEELGQRLAAGATWALGTTKKLLHLGMNESLETQMEMETRAIADAAHTEDAEEGVRAFPEKRKLVFRGRCRAGH